jgi:hypothetical protein
MFQASYSAKKHFYDEREPAFSSGQAPGRHHGRREATAAAAAADSAAATKCQDGFAQF